MYLVDPLDTGAPKVVWCDMSDGGWTLVLRGYGGSGWGSAWNETGAIDPAGVPSPEMAESFKLSDDEINALRGWAGPYRLEYTGTASPVAPPTAYVSGLCSYRHDADLFAETFANRACRTWSLASDLSSPVVSQTNHYRRGVVVGSATVGSGFLSYLTNFVEGTPERDGWYAGDIATENGFCLPSTPGCDIAMYVRAAEGAPARASCSDHLDAGATADGVYQVDPLGTGAFPVYCDMSDGGWALVARGVGGDNAADQWNTTGAIDPGVAPSPTMTRTMKLSDAAINALRQGGGRYRVQYNGTTNVFSPPPPTVYVPGTCVYDHVSPAGGACLSWSSSSNLSGLQTSLTNAARKAIVVGSTTAGTGLIHYLVNFYQVGGALNGWYAGDITQNSDWCHAGQAGCDVVMWVSGR